MDSVLQHKRDMGEFLKLAPGTPAIQDDRPINEYFLLRRTAEQWRNRGKSDDARRTGYGLPPSS
jgi:hypothetical protein